MPPAKSLPFDPNCLDQRRLPFASNLLTKMSLAPELGPDKLPSVSPTTSAFPAASTATSSPASSRDVPICFDHKTAPVTLSLVRKTSISPALGPPRLPLVAPPTNVLPERSTAMPTGTSSLLVPSCLDQAKVPFASYLATMASWPPRYVPARLPVAIPQM